MYIGLRIVLSDHVSHQQIEEEDENSTSDPAQSPAAHSVIRKHRNAEGVKTAMEGPAEDEDEDSKGQLEDQDLNLIRKLMMQKLSESSHNHPQTVDLPHRTFLAERAGGKWPTKLLPWKKLAEQLAKQAMVLVNYPENVRLPGDESNGKRSKGIADLNKQERINLIKALRDKVHPLTFLSAPEFKKGECSSILSYLHIQYDINRSHKKLQTSDCRSPPSIQLSA